jgi:transposase
MIYEKLFIGIDVSKLKHDIAIMNQHKKLVRKTFVIQEDYAGYQYLLRILNQLQDQYETNKFHIGLEATSDYWKNIYYFLKGQSDAFVLTVINPIRTKAFAKTELRRASTDSVAAKDIALFMVEKQPAPSIDRGPIFDCIKDLDGQIYAIKKQQTMISNKLRLELTKVAPEIEKHVSYIQGQQILALLQSFPTAEAIANAAVDQLATVRYGKNHWSLPIKFIQKMKHLATDSIAYKTGPGAGYVVQSLVRRIIETQQEADRLKQQMVEQYQLVNEHESVLTSIPGISQQMAIVLEAYIGDVYRFPNAKKMVAYFGMNPTIDHSGSSKKRKGHLQKKGSGIVRHKLYMAMLSVIRSNNGPIYDYYARLVQAGKPKLVAIGAAMRKLLVIIYNMLKNQQQFDPKKM